MELRAYWAIIWRRVWLIALIVGVVAIYVGYQYYHLRKTPGALTAYHSSITMLIGLEPNSRSDMNNADNVLMSDSLADALVNGPILNSQEFGTAVSRQIGEDMSAIHQRYGADPDLGDWQNAGAIAGALSSTHAHNIVTIEVNWPSNAGAWAIATAAGEVSQRSLDSYLAYAIAKETVTPAAGSIAQPVVAARVIIAAASPGVVPGASASKITQFILLLLVALIIGIALAFLLDYLDDRVRDGRDVAHLLSLPVYGEIPSAPTPGRVQATRSRKESAA